MASTSSNSVPAITTDAPNSSTATTIVNTTQNNTDDMAPLPPPSRPYAEPTAASTRTSLTHVDGDGSEDREDGNAGEGTTSHATTGAGEASTHEGPALETSKSEVEDESKPESSSSSSQPVPASSQPPTQTVHEAQAPSATITQPTQPPVPQTPQTYLTFLLISGKRRTMSFEPETTIGRVKELVWNGWPSEWQDEHPPAPSYLRVLYLGKMLQDDETLTKLKLPTYTPPSASSAAGSSPQRSTPPPHGPILTIVHLSIRPYAPPGEGDAIKKKKGKRAASSTDVSPSAADETHTGGGCCGCVIC